MTADLTDEYPYYTRSVIFDDVTNETLDICAADLGNIPCPDQYEDVQSPKFAPVKPRWTESMRDEHEALIKNETVAPADVSAEKATIRHDTYHTTPPPGAAGAVRRKRLAWR